MNFTKKITYDENIQVGVMIGNTRSGYDQWRTGKRDGFLQSGDE